MINKQLIILVGLSISLLFLLAVFRVEDEIVAHFKEVVNSVISGTPRKIDLV